MPRTRDPSFDFEKFVRTHDDNPFHRMHRGLSDYLEAQPKLGSVAPGDTGPPAMTLFAALHWLAILERVGAHGGSFEDSVIRAMVRSLWTGLAPRSK